MKAVRAADQDISQEELVEQLRSIGVEAADILLVHTSYRAVRPVEGGPAGVIDALRAAVEPEGTIVMPSWGANDDVPFEPDTTPVCRSLGVTADDFWRLHGVRRSNHPFAFAALGPHAAAITADALPVPPHRLESPVGRVYELDGKVLLLGVGHDANTTIHLPEVLAQVPYGVPKHCTVIENGRPVRVDYLENDHCCQRFALADEWLKVKGLERQGSFGHPDAHLARSRDIVAVVREHLARDPLVFLHPPDSRCAECDDASRSTYPTN